MHFSSTVSALVTALSLAVRTNAWAQAEDGTWVANNLVHTFDNGPGDPCAYWVDGKGTIANGRCYWKDATSSEMICFRFT
ncbi:hypothetical protein NW754_010917 [Fusarium falciforme]|nr:hypothetical protein NW754_010917 [Fusarium falciforme]